jgi:hypothetical protein
VEGRIDLPIGFRLPVSFQSEEQRATSSARHDPQVAIRPALEQMGVHKKIGWHSFRHGLGTMLRQLKVDPEVAQEILRLANPSSPWASLSAGCHRRETRSAE